MYQSRLKEIFSLSVNFLYKKINGGVIVVENEVRKAADMFSINFIEKNCITILCIIKNETGQLR